MVISAQIRKPWFIYAVVEFIPIIIKRIQLVFFSIAFRGYNLDKLSQKDCNEKNAILHERIR